MQGSQPAETKSQGKHTSKNIMAQRGSERLRGWAKGERIGEDASHRKETGKTNKRTKGMEGKGKAKAEAWQGQKPEDGQRALALAWLRVCVCIYIIGYCVYLCI